MGKYFMKICGRCMHCFRKKGSEHLWILPLLGFFLLWEGLGRLNVFSQDRLPLFSAVVFALMSLASQFEFVCRVLQSFANLTAGILLALSVALPTALLAGLRSKVDLALTPIVMLVGALPDLALLPVMIVWFGSGNLAAMIMAAICAFFPLYFTVREGAKAIPTEYFHVTTVYRSGRLDVLRKMILPAVFPSLVTGLRLSFDFVWEIILAIEIIARVAGVGTFIDASVANDSIEGAFAGIMAVGIIALSVDRMVFGMLDARIGRWRE